MTHLHWLHFSGLVHESRCLGVSESVESSNPQFQWIDRLTTLRASVLSISATSGPHQCSRQWSPTFLRIGVTKHYLSSAIFSLWLAETGLLLLNPLAQVCTLLVPLQYNSCFMLVDADFVCLYCMCLHLLAYHAWRGPPIQLLTAAKRISPHPSSIWKWMPPSVVHAAAAWCCMFFNIVQLIAKSCGVWTQATPVTPVTSPGVWDLHL